MTERALGANVGRRSALVGAAGPFERANRANKAMRNFPAEQSYGEKRRVLPHVDVVSRHEKPPTWRKAEKPERERAPLGEVRYVQRFEEVPRRRGLFSSPYIPPGRISPRWMAESVQRLKAEADVYRDSDLEIVGRANPPCAVRVAQIFLLSNYAAHRPNNLRIARPNPERNPP